MRIPNIRNRQVSVGTLLALFGCGVGGVLIDLDHIWGGREAHTPVLVFGLCLIGACLTRLFCRMVLRGNND